MKRKPEESRGEPGEREQWLPPGLDIYQRSYLQLALASSSRSSSVVFKSSFEQLLLALVKIKTENAIYWRLAKKKGEDFSLEI